MSTPYSKTLLRRTFAVLAAVAASSGVSDAMAAKVKLSTGTECDYSSMSITPDGGVVVTCAGAETPTPSPSPSPSPTPTPGPTPVPTGCPAAPTDMLTATLPGPGNPIKQMQASGQIVAIPLPTIAGNKSVVVSFAESAGGAYTPSPVRLELSINKCPGMIDSDPTNACNVNTQNGTFNSIKTLNEAYSILTSAATASKYGYCWAADGGTYYVNARWTYASCAFGAQVCGFTVAYNKGPF